MLALPGVICIVLNVTVLTYDSLSICEGQLHVHRSIEISFDFDIFLWPVLVSFWPYHGSNAARSTMFWNTLPC